MGGFAIEDAIIKQLAISLPISQVLISVGLSGLFVFFVLSKSKGEPLVKKGFMGWRFFLRIFCELVSSILFVTTIVYVSLTVSSALLQITPILATVGGFLLFKQKV